MKIKSKRWYKKQLQLAESQLDSRMLVIEALRQELRDVNKEIKELETTVKHFIEGDNYE